MKPLGDFENFGPYVGTRHRREGRRRSARRGTHDPVPNPVPFFERLGGEEDGPYQRWRRAVGDKPRICWYPASGFDYRDLLFVPPRPVDAGPRESMILGLPKEEAPQLYLHVDPLGSSPRFPEKFAPWVDREGFFYEDGRTRMTILEREELEPIDLPFDLQALHSSGAMHHLGRWVFLRLQIESDTLGTYEVPLLTGFVDAVAFADRILLAEEISVKFVTAIRVKTGFGVDWLLKILPALQTEYLFIEGGLNCTGRFARESYPRIAKHLPERIGSLSSGGCWKGGVYRYPQ